jgi:hypothetical protein
MTVFFIEAVISASLLYPLDVIKTKQIMSLVPLSFGDATLMIWRTDGYITISLLNFTINNSIEKFQFGE